MAIPGGWYSLFILATPMCLAWGSWAEDFPSLSRFQDRRGNFFYASSTNTVIGKFLYVDFILVAEKVLQFAYTLRESFVNYLKAVALIKIKDVMWQEIKWK